MAANTRVKAVLWDVDDTVFDYTRADTEGLAAHLRAEGLLERFGGPETALARWRALTRHHWGRFAAGGVGFLEQRRDRVRDFLAAPLGDAEADAWFDAYFAHYEAAWTLFTDVLPALDALARSHRHGVLSNSSAAVQGPKLTALGLGDRFESLLCAAELGVSKPEPGAFRAAARALGLAPAEIAYVGDEPWIDARGAVDAGLVGVWLDRAGRHAREDVPEGVHRIGGLRELPGLLADTRFGAPSTFG
ncbi:HAD family hydrolase [Streptomyces sp. SPB074]|uniref:HAD family hydrolase n=1 Tax=Streptomyces sp. (strain SPB074) TaxID=465543 RepID=UPI00017F1F25|nr:HAD family hydrolase [Streptomyces sp. SPB074]EFG64577.1 hydrolase [Streptomyces sp. SPB074]